MANTYTYIASSTVGLLGASTIDFTSIPNTYTDLLLRISARTTRASYTDAISLSINGVATNQTSRYLAGNGASSTSGSLTTFRTLASAATANASAFGNSDFYIPNYAGSTYKAVESDGSTGNSGVDGDDWLVANLWSATSAINQLTITDVNSATFVQYTTAYLYGIVKS